MAMMGEGNTCNPTPEVGAISPFKNGTLVISLPGIVEVLSSTSGCPNLDIFNRDFEWTVLKRKNRGGNKEDVGSPKRVA